jgi:hypothetical protein
MTPQPGSCSVPCAFDSGPRTPWAEDSGIRDEAVEVGAKALAVGGIRQPTALSAIVVDALIDAGWAIHIKTGGD